ncbi:MAG: PAS domain-containing protein [Acidobacteria bacterium]|nr:PAS domain-containing protein [Acidobacteriota bacterium]
MPTTVSHFSEGPSRIFARSRAIIGRKVQHCHPPKSVDTVNRILDDFRAGLENVAGFWMNFQVNLYTFAISRAR